VTRLAALTQLPRGTSPTAGQQAGPGPARLGSEDPGRQLGTPGPASTSPPEVTWRPLTSPRPGATRPPLGARVTP
jgi:hypothetical protein